MHTRIYTHIYPTANTQFGMRCFVVPRGTTVLDSDCVDDWKYARTTMDSVIIPKDVKSIEKNAFANCIHLKTVRLPGSVRLIAEKAFADCVELTSVTIQPGIERIKQGAFFRCRSLVDVKIPLMSMKGILEPNVFIGCNENLILNIGRIKDVNKPNFWKGFGGGNGIARTATVEHTLPDKAGTCIAQYNWPASKVIRRTDRYGCPMYADTEPDPPTLFDGTGIEAPLQLQTRDGDKYPVYYCWGKDPVAHPDFKRLAADQHPDALSKLNSWDVLLHNTDVATHTLDLEAVGNMIVRGEIDLSEPVLLVWTEGDGSDNELGGEDANGLNSSDSDDSDEDSDEDSVESGVEDANELSSSDSDDSDEDSDEDSVESGVEDANELSSSDSDDSDEDSDEDSVESGVEDANELSSSDSDNKSETPIEDANTPNRLDKNSAAPNALKLERTSQLCDMCC